MFIGHFAVGFAAKRAAPKTSLGLLMAAPLLLDFLWPVFSLAGWEQTRIDPGNTAFTPLDFVSYPFSHSLVTAIGWGLLAAIGYWLVARYLAGAVVIGLGVVSHWLFDALVHRPDLPLYPGPSPLVGLGLWNSIAGTIVVEGLLFAVGVWLYVSMTRSRDRLGTYGLWSFVTLLVVLYIANVAGPPPPSVRAMLLVSLSGLLFPFWAAWFDRHRQVQWALLKRRKYSATASA